MINESILLIKKQKLLNAFSLSGAKFFRLRPVCPWKKSFRWCVPWIRRPLDEESLGRSVLWTRRPCTIHPLGGGVRGGGGLWLGEVLNYHLSDLTLPKLACHDKCLDDVVWCSRLGTNRSGAHRPRDTSSKGRHVHKGRNIRDIFFGKHIVIASFVLCWILPFLDVRIKLRHFINSLSAKFPLIDNI